MKAMVIAVFWNANGFELWCEDGSVERWAKCGDTYRRVDDK